MKTFFSNNVFQYLASFSGAFNLISYGMYTSWTSPFLPYLTSESSIIPITNEEGSWLAICNLMGCPIGAIIGSVMADKLGRKRSILMMAPVAIIYNVSIAFARNVWILYIARFIMGLTDGASYSIVPVYIGEIAVPEIRGFLSSLLTFYFLVGILLMNVIGSFWSIFTCALISGIVPLLHFFTFIFMPESPYWYIKIGKYNEAEKSLQIFRGTSDVKKQLEIINTAIREEEMKSKSKFTDLFTVPSNRRACFITCLVALQQKATAKTPIMLYTKRIFEESGSSISSTVSTIAYCSIELLIVTLTGLFILDRFGKRVLCIISIAGSIVTLFIIGGYFLLKDSNSDWIRYFDWLPLTALMTYNFFNSIGISFAPFCFACELFPTGVRANAVTLTEVTMSCGSVVSGKLFHWLEDYFGTFSAPFLTFSLLSLIAFVFVLKVVPETKGKTLEEIQLFLKGKDK